MSESKPRLELLVGNIASGKSTYCKKAADEGFIIINDDAIVNAVHAGNYKLYNEDLKPLYKSTENAILNTALAMKQSVIIDRPNHTAAMRRRYIGIAHSFDVPVHVVMFAWAEPEVHAQRRFDSDSRGLTLEDWLYVANYHQDNYEEPDLLAEELQEIVDWQFPN